MPSEGSPIVNLNKRRRLQTDDKTSMTLDKAGPANDAAKGEKTTFREDRADTVREDARSRTKAPMTVDDDNDNDKKNDYGRGEGENYSKNAALDITNIRQRGRVVKDRKEFPPPSEEDIHAIAQFLPSQLDDDWEQMDGAARRETITSDKLDLWVRMLIAYLRQGCGRLSDDEDDEEMEEECVASLSGTISEEGIFIAARVAVLLSDDDNAAGDNRTRTKALLVALADAFSTCSDRHQYLVAPTTTTRILTAVLTAFLRVIERILERSRQLLVVEKVEDLISTLFSSFITSCSFVTDDDFSDIIVRRMVPTGLSHSSARMRATALRLLARYALLKTNIGRLILKHRSSSNVHGNNGAAEKSSSPAPVSSPSSSPSSLPASQSNMKSHNNVALSSSIDIAMRLMEDPHSIVRRASVAVIREYVSTSGDAATSSMLIGMYQRIVPRTMEHSESEPGVRMAALTLITEIAIRLQASGRRAAVICHKLPSQEASASKKQAWREELVADNVFSRVCRGVNDSNAFVRRTATEQLGHLVFASPSYILQSFSKNPSNRNSRGSGGGGGHDGDDTKFKASNRSSGNSSSFVDTGVSRLLWAGALRHAWEDEMSGVRRAAVKTLGSFASSASSSSSSTSDDTVSTTTTTRGLLERSQQKTSLTKVYAMAEVKMEILKQGGSVMFDLVLDPSPQVRLESLTELFRVCSSLRLDRKQIETLALSMNDSNEDVSWQARKVATRVLCASPSDLHILTKMMLKILSESKTENDKSATMISLLRQLGKNHKGFGAAMLRKGMLEMSRTFLQENQTSSGGGKSLHLPHTLKDKGVQALLEGSGDWDLLTDPHSAASFLNRYK